MSQEDQSIKQGVSGKRKLSDWTAHMFRLTVFHRDLQTVYVEDWWSKIVGEKPDLIRALPKLNQILMQSTYGLGTVTLEVNPITLNWIYQVSPDPEERTDDLDLSLGALKPALETFIDITNKWFSIDSSSDASRIAFGAALEIPAGNQQDAYKILSDFLPHLKLDENCSDLSYRINRCRYIEIGELRLKINRISTWQARALAQEGVIIGPTSTVHLPSEIKSVASRLELDINTDQNYSGAMNRQLQQEILSRLTTLGLEIAEKGDIS